jgi:hypothetical protein
LPVTSGTACAVCINFYLIGKAIVDDVRDFLHVESARCYVGSDQELEVFFAEALHHPVAVALGQVAVQGIGVIAIADHLFGDFLGFYFGTAENQSRLDTRNRHPPPF